MIHPTLRAPVQFVIACSLGAPTLAWADVVFIETTWHTEATAADQGGSNTSTHFGNNVRYYVGMAYEGSLLGRPPLASAFAYHGSRVDSLFGQAGIVTQGDLMGKNSAIDGAGIGTAAAGMVTTFVVTDTRAFTARAVVSWLPTSWSSAEMSLTREGETIFSWATGRAGSDPTTWTMTGELQPGTYTFRSAVQDGWGDATYASGRTRFDMTLAMPTPGAGALLVAAGVATRRRRPTH